MQDINDVNELIIISLSYQNNHKKNAQTLPKNI